MTLRASSLAAVMILVWSTRPRPASIARVRVIWRTLTTSSDDRMSRRSLFAVVAIFRLRRVQTLLDHRHAAFDVQRRLDARQREPELDQRDGDRRTHPDYDRVGVENARHRRDVVQHAADEAVDDLQRRDVDQ